MRTLETSMVVMQFVVLLVVALFISQAAAQELRVRDGVSLNLRNGAGTNHAVTGRLQPGTKMFQIGMSIPQPEWRYVRISGEGDLRGWVHSDFVEWTTPIDWTTRSPQVSLVSAVERLEELATVAVNDEKTLMATVSRGARSIQIWDFGTGRLLKTIQPDFSFEEERVFFLRDHALFLRKKDTENGLGAAIIDVVSGDAIYDGAHIIYGPLNEMNVDGREIYYSYSTGTISYYNKDDYSKLAGGWSALTSMKSRLSLHTKIINIFRDSTILVEARTERDSQFKRALFLDHELTIKERTGEFQSEFALVGANIRLRTLYLGRNSKIYKASFSNPNEVTPIGDGDAHFAKYAQNDIIAFSEVFGDNINIYNTIDDDLVSFKSPFSETYIQYFDGKFIVASGEIRSPSDGLIKSTGIIRIDIETGDIINFEHNAEAIEIGWILPGVDSSDLRIVKQNFLDFTADGRDFDTALLVETDTQVPSFGMSGRDYIAPSGKRFVQIDAWDRNPFKGNILGLHEIRHASRADEPLLGDGGKLFKYKGPWTFDDTGAFLLAVDERERLVLLDTDRMQAVTLDPERVREIIQAHWESAPGANDADTLVQMLKLTVLFDRTGTKIHILAERNERVGLADTINTAHRMLINDLKKQGRPYDHIKLTDLSEARGLDTTVYSFAIDDGRFLGETALETRNCQQPVQMNDGNFICFDFRSMTYLDAQSGRILLTRNNLVSGWITATALFDDGRKLAVGSTSGDIALFDTRTGTRQAGLTMFEEGSWLMMTSEGFYASTGEADSRLRVSLGVERTYPIDKFRDALYRPDLVAEKLRGDPEKLVANAASSISLERILQSGAAPEVIINGDLQGESVRAEAAISDAGGGIGRLEWRVNGVVQHSEEGKTSSTAELFLASGENRVELVAYNRENTIQGRSEPLSFTMPDDKVSPPRLFVLALGVDAYGPDFLKLKYATRDAVSVGAAFGKAGAGLYSEVFVDVLTDADVTRNNLEERFRRLAKSVRPNDVFVFFSAGHGKTLDGRFFFIPQDFTGTTLASIREQGIGHATWQEWFSLIPAQKSLLLFDSCESGTLTESVVGRELRFRAANDLLGNATGRALIAASSGTGFALEGYKDHGIFAWSILDALQKADKDENGLIDVDELATSIEEMVPRIAEEAFGEKQVPQFKAPMRGFDVVSPLEAAE